MIRRTVLEWDIVPYGQGEMEIPRDAADRLAAVAESAAIPGALHYQRNGLRASGVVGVIVAPGAEVEILPKIETPGQHGGQAAASIRKHLVHMLAAVLDINVADGDMAHLDTQNETLLEVLIRLFSRRLCAVVKHGLPRRYVKHADDLPAMRGRLDAARQFSTLAVSPQKLACRYDEMTCDIPLNQIMKAAVERLLRLARAADNQRRLRELAFIYADVSAVPVAALRWDSVTLDRTTTRWLAPFRLARLLLGQRFQTTSGGMTQGFSLLFEMNVLFEKYIASKLRGALAGTGLHVTTQGGRRYALYTPDKKGVFRTIPDILIRRGDRIVQIIDTKWKRLAQQVDDPKQGISQADVYQMMAYARIYDCPRLMLLYPHHARLGAAPVRNAHCIATDTGPDVLEVATVDMFATTGLQNRLRQLCEA
ncbi:McrC family protein [Gluconobacter sp. Dm-73]|uniref:McrC family protein n=1 Tax=Gluconobacter sp. Dm-73 TaxID=2799802 RepID=UPI001B8BDBB0|nr:McrC family protein [Gluconobacter sp. Dm-73]MBS1074701.1 McrC family protein [Gluconobacter sp. Dm-73]